MLGPVRASHCTRGASVALLSVLAGVALTPRAARAEEPAPGPSQQQIEAFLASKPASADVSKAPDAPEAPPPPPRRHGFVVESSIGALTHVGALRHISPTAPWMRAAFGWEPTKWLMLLAQGDVAFASTSFASPPPDPRTYALWGLSVGLRFGFQPTTAFGFYVQGEAGATSVTEKVLSTYGFRDADGVGPYFGAQLGLEWYQINPHTALVAIGGIRSYGQVLDRSIDDGPNIGWTAAAGLKYTF